MPTKTRHRARHRRVHSFLLRLAGRADTAEDLAQETWIKLAKAATGLREDTRIGPLLFTIAHVRCGHDQRRTR